MPAKAKQKPKPGGKQKQKPMAKPQQPAHKLEVAKPIPPVEAVLYPLIGDEQSLDVVADELIEPDESLLTQQEEDLDDALTLRSHELAAELSEDPVRLYLREIGQVKLLDSDSEFRLATLSEADRYIATLRKLKHRKGFSQVSSIYRSLLSEMLTSWERLIEDAERLEHELPDLALTIADPSLYMQAGNSIRLRISAPTWITGIGEWTIFGMDWRGMPMAFF